MPTAADQSDLRSTAYLQPGRDLLDEIGVWGESCQGEPGRIFRLGDPRANRVIAQNPVAGTEVEVGSTVTIVVVAKADDLVAAERRPRDDPVEEVTFRRSNAFDLVREESLAVRERVGLTEVSNFSKYRVEGPGAGAWLQGLFTNRLPKPGRIALTAMLNDHAKVIGEFSVALAPSSNIGNSQICWPVSRR